MYEWKVCVHPTFCEANLPLKPVAEQQDPYPAQVTEADGRVPHEASTPAG